MISASGQVVDRVLDEASPAGRPRCRSACPASPGRSLSSASSTPRVTSSVFAPGNFSTTSSRPVAVVDDRVADQRLVVDLTSATSLRRSRPPVPSTGTLPELLGVGDALEDVADLQPLLRRLDEAAGARRRGLEEAQRRDDLRVAGRRDDLVERHVAVAQALGVDLDLQLLVAHAPDRRRWRRRGRPSAAGASSSARSPTSRSATARSEESPIIITRLDDDSGCSIVGGLETFGRACAWVSRSWTSWRAR